MEDFAALLDAHSCGAGHCSRNTHTQFVLVSPADLATTTDQVRTFAAVRDCLTEHGFRMLETVPPPRFDDGAAEPAPWAVRYDPAWGRPSDSGSGSAGASTGSPLRSLWPFGRRRTS